MLSILLIGVFLGIFVGSVAYRIVSGELRLLVSLLLFILLGHDASPPQIAWTVRIVFMYKLFLFFVLRVQFRFTAMNLGFDRADWQLERRGDLRILQSVVELIQEQRPRHRVEPPEQVG
jgi:hypothetical protein